MKPAAVLIALIATLAAAGCGGDSKEDKARAQVCDARDDISSQVQKLSDMEITTATTSQAARSRQRRVMSRRVYAPGRQTRRGPPGSPAGLVVVGVGREASDQGSIVT